MLLWFNYYASVVSGSFTQVHVLCTLQLVDFTGVCVCARVCVCDMHVYILLSEEKDFRMLVKATHEVFSKWENIGVCLSIPSYTMDNLGHKWRSKSCHQVVCGYPLLCGL